MTDKDQESILDGIQSGIAALAEVIENEWNVAVQRLTDVFDQADDMFATKQRNRRK